MIFIKNPEDLEQYFDEKSRTYNLFSYSHSSYELPKVYVDCNIDVCGSILAPEIHARGFDIKCGNLTCYDLDANNINCMNLISEGSVLARNINAGNVIVDFDLDVCKIKAYSIQADTITAKEIRYHLVCYTEHDLKCESIFPQWDTSKHFSVRGDVIINWKRGNK